MAASFHRKRVTVQLTPVVGPLWSDLAPDGPQPGATCEYVGFTIRLQYCSVCGSRPAKLSREQAQRHSTDKRATPAPGLRPERVFPSGHLWSRLGGSSYGRRMVDDFSERYGDLLTGSYDCVDRVVLNATYPMGHAPGVVAAVAQRQRRAVGRQPPDANGMRMAGRFARRSRRGGRRTRFLSFTARAVNASTGSPRNTWPPTTS